MSIRGSVPKTSPRGHVLNRSSVWIQVHPWLLPRGASRERVPKHVTSGPHADLEVNHLIRQLARVGSYPPSGLIALEDLHQPRNLRFKFETFGTAFGRRGFRMVRGERPRLHGTSFVRKYRKDFRQETGAM